VGSGTKALLVAGGLSFFTLSSGQVNGGYDSIEIYDFANDVW
jgi:hypothetical protein